MSNLPSLKQLRIPAYLSIRKGVNIGASDIAFEQRFSNVYLDSKLCRDYIDFFGFEGDLPLPVLYPFAQRAHLVLMLDKRFTIGVPGMVHLSNFLKVEGPIDPALPFDLHASVKVEAKAEGSLLPYLYLDYYQGDNKVAYCESKYLARRKSNSVNKRKKRNNLPINNPSYKAEWKLDVSMAKAYASISGDYNPIHLSYMFARLAGFKRCIMHGWYSASRATASAEKLAHKPAKSLKISFLKPVLLPSESLFMMNGSETEKHFALEREGVRMLAGEVGF